MIISKIKKIGFGGLRILTDLCLQEKLSRNNVVFNPNFLKEGENFRSTAMKAIDADSFFLSANALSEDGAIVNIDCTGNCLTGLLFGHKKIGTNKIILNREEVTRRAGNVAAPKNSIRFNLKNPSAIV